MHCGILLFAADGLTGQVVAEFPLRGARRSHRAAHLPASPAIMRRDWAALLPPPTRPMTRRWARLARRIAALGIKSILIGPPHCSGASYRLNWAGCLTEVRRPLYY